MRNFIQAGDNLTIPAPAVTMSGEVVIVGAISGVAAGNAAEGAPLDVVTVGVFELPKVAAQAIPLGGRVYYDSAAKLVTTTASGNTLIGVAVRAAANPSATVEVKLGVPV